MKQPILTYGTKLYNGKRNLIIILFLIDLCNYNCIYCGNTFPRTYTKLNITFIIEQLDALLKTIDGCIYVELLGGEPTLHPDFYTLCEKLATNKRFHVNVYTNYSADINLYINLYRLGINIIPSWHSNLIDLQNNEFINKIIYTQTRINQEINIRIMYEPEQHQYAINAFNKLSQYNNINIEFAYVYNTPQYSVKYTNEQLQLYTHINNNLIHANNDIIVQYSDNSINKIGYYDFINSNLSFKFWQCNAGYDSLYIHSNGNVYSCPKFFIHNMTPLYNINITNKIIMQKHKTLCPFNFGECECDKELRKQKIFNK